VSIEVTIPRSAPFALVFKTVWIVKELTNHEMNFFCMCSLVKWHLILSKTFVEEISLPSPFATVRNQSGQIVNAQP